jgi:hypothetical protein
MDRSGRAVVELLASSFAGPETLEGTTRTCPRKPRIGSLRDRLPIGAAYAHAVL